MGIGIALVILGLASAAVVIDLLVENAPPGTLELSLFGVTRVHLSLSLATSLAAALAAAAVLFVVLGAVLAVKARRRAREDSGTDAYTQTAGLEARARLLEFRLRDLQGKVDEPFREVRPARPSPGTEARTEPLVVLPDVGPPGPRAGDAPSDRPSADRPADGT